MDDDKQFVTREQYEELKQLHADVIDVLDRVRDFLIHLVSSNPSPDLIAAVEEAFARHGDDES